MHFTSHPDPVLVVIAVALIAAALLWPGKGSAWSRLRRRWRGRG